MVKAEIEITLDFTTSCQLSTTFWSHFKPLKSDIDLSHSVHWVSTSANSETASTVIVSSDSALSITDSKRSVSAVDANGVSPVCKSCKASLTASEVLAASMSKLNCRNSPHTNRTEMASGLEADGVAYAWLGNTWSVGLGVNVGIGVDVAVGEGVGVAVGIAAGVTVGVGNDVAVGAVMAVGDGLGVGVVAVQDAKARIRTPISNKRYISVFLLTHSGASMMLGSPMPDITMVVSPLMASGRPVIV